MIPAPGGSAAPWEWCRGCPFLTASAPRVVSCGDGFRPAVSTVSTVSEPVPDAVPRTIAGLHPTVVTLASTHFIVDAYNNIYAPLLPLFIPHLGLSLTAVGTLAMCFQMASSVSQLGFGALADRWRPRVLLIAGPLLSVVVLSCVGWATSPLMLGALLVLGGLGGAAFHPPAAAGVFHASGLSKGFAMSVHITGGSVGMAMAPLFFAPTIERLGLHWSPIIAVPGLLALWFLLRRVPPVEPGPAGQREGFGALRPYARPLTLLYFSVVLRTLTSASFSVFMPVLLTSQGMSIANASLAVTCYLLVSGVGGFAGGTLADRFGPRRVILVSLVSAVPFMVAAAMLEGWWLAAAVSIGGLLLQSTLPVNVTYAQMLAPVGAATVSSLMMGFAWGVGSTMVPVVGLLADTMGLPRALLCISVVPLLAAVLAAQLPERQTRAVPAHQPTPPDAAL
jgi:FSR family fosmidomycin resistance protein-like MFS transporter